MSMQRIRVKVCGLTRPQDVSDTVAAGADAIGLVFYPPSPRAVSIAQAQQLIKNIPPYVQVVGLFVNPDETWLSAVNAEVALDMLQFHGDETPERCAHLAASVGRRWYKALQVRQDASINDINYDISRYRAAGASAILLDAWHPQLKGGTGQAFDWSLFPRNDNSLILAGGLRPDNVATAIAQTQPYAVDVSGGVESAKGIKNRELIQQFIQEIAHGNN